MFRSTKCKRLVPRFSHSLCHSKRNISTKECPKLCTACSLTNRFSNSQHRRRHRTPAIQTNNINKPKQKRSKIVIRDPSKDNKNVTEEILHSSTANARTGSTPPLTNSTVQTDSSKIQAQFAAQAAARVGGEKGKQINERKAEDTGKG